jgi:hypothetical protein
MVTSTLTPDQQPGDVGQLAPRLDWRGRAFHGPKRDPTSYAASDAPVLAVSDAKVVAAGDGQPDQVPGDPKPASPERADGNFVMLDLGDGRYANYARRRRRICTSTSWTDRCSPRRSGFRMSSR